MASERRHEERHGREQARVHREREAGVEQALRVDLEVAGDDAPGVARRDLEDEAAELDLGLRPGGQRRSGSAPESSAHGCVLPCSMACCTVILGWPAISMVPVARCGSTTLTEPPRSASTMGARVVPSFSEGMK